MTTAQEPAPAASSTTASTPGAPSTVVVTPQQMSMLMFSEDGPGSAPYGVSNLLRVEDDVEPAAIVAGWRTVFEEFSALRSRFDADARGEWSLLIDGEVAEQVQLVELRPADPGELETRMREAALQAADPRRHPSAHVLAGPTSYVVLSYHHALLDGWSSAALVQRAGEHVRAAAGLGAAPRHIGDSMPQGQEALVAAAHDEAARDHWVEALASTPRSVVGRSADETPDYAEIVERIDAGLWRRVLGAARELGVSPSTLVMTAYAAALSSALGQAAVGFGLTTSLRGLVDGVEEDAVGLFINTLPVTVRVEEAPTWGDLAAAVRGHLAQVVEHASVDIASLSSLTHRSTAGLFDTALAFQTYPGADDRFTTSPDHPRRGLTTVTTQDHTHYALTVAALPADDDSWALRVCFDASRVGPADVRTLLEAMTTALVRLTDAATGPVTAVSPAWAVAAPATPTATPTDAAAAAEHIDPETLDAVSSLWEEFFGHPFAPEDDFFRAGGTSLTAMRFAMRLQSALGIRMAVRTIFDGPTGGAILSSAQTARTTP